MAEGLFAEILAALLSTPKMEAVKFLRNVEQGVTLSKMVFFTFSAVRTSNTR
jgi:hypothetical protein